MFSPFERMVAARYLRARRAEGFVSVIAGFSFLGITLGVAALIIVLSVMNGFRHDLLNRILGVNGQITVYGFDGRLDDFDSLAKRLTALAAVRHASPIVEGQVLAASRRGQTSGALVRGVRAGDLAARRLVAESLTPGALDRFAAGGAVVMGARLAERLGLSPGDPVTLISPQGTPTLFGTMPRSLAYPLAGTFDVGMYEYDNGFIYMPLADAQRYFQLGNAVTGIELDIADPFAPGALEKARRAVIEVVGARGRIYDWQQANAQFFGAIQVERNVMFIILTLIVLVAAFNIVSSLIMLVKDKGRDIAILRTMGATRGMVMRIFFLTGASIGVAGTLSGLALGIAFAANIETIRRWIEGLTGSELFAEEIYFLSQLPARIDGGEVATVVLLSLVLSFLATLYPSWRAARLDPVEALRYE